MGLKIPKWVFGGNPLLTAVRILAFVSILLLTGLFMGCYMLKMPGTSYTGALPQMSQSQTALSTELRGHVEELAVRIGPRNFIAYDSMKAAVGYVEESFRRDGLATSRLDFKVGPSPLASWRGAKNCDDLVFSNVIGELKGSVLPDEIVVIGSHYDTAPVDRCAGADDNASGVAATMALARHFAKSPQKRTLRFIAFANEEPPFFWTDDMGSRVCAKDSSKKGERIVAMLTPESVGYYSDEPGSQHYPWPLNHLYPTTGDFIAFIGSGSSAPLVKDCVEVFRENAKFPSEGAALPFIVPGVGWSDHWSYTKEGYPALMVTNTATFRNRHYHTPGDSIDKLDFDRMARVVEGLVPVLEYLANR